MFKDLNNPQMHDLKQLFSGLPKVKEEFLPPLLNSENSQCEFCKKFLPIKNMRIINTGIVNALEPLCESCRETFKDQARVVCVTCKLVVLWVDPNKDQHGFEFKRRHMYHIKNCPACKEGLTEASILEKVIFYKENNIPFV